MTPAERAIVIANTLDVFLGSRQKNQQLDAVVNEIKEAEQEAYAKGFADAIEKAAKRAELWPGDGGIIAVSDPTSPTSCMNALRDGITRSIRALALKGDANGESLKPEVSNDESL